MLRLLSLYSPSDVIQERCDKSVAHSASWPVTACMNRHPISDAMIVRRPRGTVRVKRPLAGGRLVLDGDQDRLDGLSGAIVDDGAGDRSGSVQKTSQPAPES
jgi:hypothetical protein